MGQGSGAGRFLVSLLLVGVASVSAALERPAHGEIARYRADGSLSRRLEFVRQLGNHRVDPALVQSASYRLQRQLWERGETSVLPTPPLAWRGMPSTGNVKVLALLISFSDYLPNAADTNAVVNSRLFLDGSGVAPYESVRNFYRRASYNQLEISGNTVGWYQTAYPRSSVPMTWQGREALLKEALNSYNALGHDFAQYDNNTDGVIDYFIVIWTGPNNGWGNFWWGYQTGFNDSTYTLDGKRLGKYSWQWESSNGTGTFAPNVAIHETGHALGLPDYYDYDPDAGPDGGVGGLDQMDANWGDHNCFSKFLLDWITPTVIAGGTNPVSLRGSGTDKDAVLFAKGTTGSLFSEYFMVQNRRRVGNDTGSPAYPAEGLLVWHVDAKLNGGGTDYLYDNSWTDHKLLRLMEADGLEEIETGDGNADAGDYYVSGRTISAGSLPSTVRYDGVANPLRLAAIGATADPMTATIDEVVDASAPTGAPGTPTDAGATSADTSLAFGWTAGTAADAESGIAGYELQVGTTPGGSDLYGGLVGNVTTRTVADARDGATYFARVRAVNAAGLRSSWSGNSDGITVVLPALACTALDNCALTFKAPSVLPWFQQSVQSYYGGSAAQSADIGNNQSSWFQTTLVGPGTLSFWWKVSSEQDWDFLRVYLDGAESGTGISGEVAWSQRTIAIGAGTHVVRWVYSKDVIYDGGSDAGWVDRVEWTGASVPTLSIGDASVTEGAASTTKTATFTVTLSASSAQAVGVNWTTAAGTASAGTDYVTASGTLTLPAGQTSGSIGITVNGDAVDETNETFFVNLSGPANATVADGQGLGTITDDDGPTVSAGDVSVTEGASGTTTVAAFPVTLSAASPQAVTVNYTTSAQTATAGVDYQVVSSALVIPAGQTSGTASVTVIGDALDETNETFAVVLQSVVNATIVDPTGVATIMDDDGPSASINDVTVTEGAAGAATTAAFTVTLSAASVQAVLVGWGTTNGTAVAGSDYVNASDTLTIPAGQTSGTVSVTVNGDALDEANETFNVNVLGVLGGTVGDGVGVGTITDDDPAPSLSVGDVAVTEGDAGTKTATFTVSLSAASGKAVTVSYATADGTATVADADYVAASGSLSFAAGVTSRTVGVAVNGDLFEEADESFSLLLSSPVNAVVLDGQGSGTIANDDTDDPLDFFTVTPCRVVDTRMADGALGGPALSANTERVFTLAGPCTVPATARALSVNVTVVDATERGNLSLYPADVARPLASVINHVAGLTRANNAVVPLSASGQLAVFCSQASGTVHVVIDVNGYFQ